MNKEGTHTDIQEIDKERLIDILTEELPVLRAKIGLSQDDFSNIIGLSRQTCSSIETKKRRMSWNVFLSMLMFFMSNEKTAPIVSSIGLFPEELKKYLDISMR